MPEGKTIAQLHIGDKVSCTHTFTLDDAKRYAELIGDYNPIHFDDEFAMKTKFKGKIVHGMMVAGYISRLIGMELPGPGCIYAGQNIQFRKPVHYGDAITTVIEVLQMEVNRNRVVLATRCYNQEEQLVIDGDAVVLPRLPAE